MIIVIERQKKSIKKREKLFFQHVREHRQV